MEILIQDLKNEIIKLRDNDIQVILGGDFNVHWDRDEKYKTLFLKTFEELDLEPLTGPIKQPNNKKPVPLGLSYH